ncbi:MAG TPA: DMT family transporter [Ardenticatenaceae bacterium]|nr:DMT family transporter [Ardenticatenaceae bacterium]
MTGFALVLVLAAAGIHASWNLLAKRARGGVAFNWLLSALGALVYAPLAAAIIVFQRPHISSPQLVFMAGTSILHTAYFLFLSYGYRSGDLSVVYPLARGTGPLLSTVAAIILLGERPSPLALCGTVLIGAGVFFLTGNPARLDDPAIRRSIGFALLTGIIIAAYTLWDKHAVSALLVPPLLLDWSSSVGRMLILTPSAYRRRDEVRAEWRDHRFEAVGVGVLGSLSYILVLTAMVFSPVSYVAPAREISILVGALLGTRLLAEGDSARRLTASTAMVLGVIALALG